MSDPREEGGQDDWPRPAIAWSTVGVLLVVYVFSFADRQILSLLVAPVKADLNISDTQFSLLSGLAFALFYTVLGVPFGRLADRMSRRALISAGAFLWSLMTMVSGLTHTYWQLFAARVGVGVGEAALGPAAFSMLSDLFPPEKRARAFSVYSLGIYIGAGLAFGLGGIIAGSIAANPRTVLPVVGEVASWQAVFFIIGGPGLLLPLLMFMLPEPARRGPRIAEPLALGDAARWVWQRRRLFGPYFIGFGVMVLYGFAVLAWAPELFRRIHGMDIREVGTTIGLTMAFAGSAGVLAGGYYTDRLRQRGKADSALIAGIVSALAGIIPGVLFPLVAAPGLALALLAAVFFTGAFASGAAPAALGLVTPNEMRGQVSALYLLAINVLGIALGPTVPALLTDFAFADEMRLGWSLSVTALATGAIATWLLIRARPEFMRACAV